MNFEAEVRRIAEAVWDLPPGHCQPMHHPDDPVVREIDGIARLRDVTHLLMVTTSTRLDKVKEDVKKLQSAEVIERTRAPAVSKWLITQTQLDAQHVEHARKSNVMALTLAQFQRRFFDSAKYLSLRSRWTFGSARDPQTDSITISDNAYVELPMRLAADSTNGSLSTNRRSVTLGQLVQRIRSGELIVMRAPFGSGKSLTTRELFKILSSAHLSTPTEPVPLALNLREHWGEDHSDEILERHARAIGYSPREDIVVAWRAGMCCLLLDGFDEVAAQTVVRTDNKNFMRDARRRALDGVRDFTQKLPNGVGVFICGRDHYFDTVAELASSLGISGRKYAIVDLEEFTESNANEFLKRNGIKQALPDWLPRKPLILSYLLREKLFADILAIDSSKGFGYAWDEFLNRISEREAALERSSMDPATIRAVLERLAESVRSKASGTGPITGSDLADAYSAETGQPAGEGVLAQLQRLPGLTQRDAEAGSRSFVDLDMLGALQGSAFAKQVLAGFRAVTTNPLSGLSEKAVAMAAYLLAKSEASVDTLVSVFDQLVRASQRERISPQHIADCLTVAFRLAIDTDRSEIDLRGAVIDGASFDRIPLDEIRLRNARFQNCTVRELAFGDSGDLTGVSFQNCLISRVCGVANTAGLPKNVVKEDCEVETFDNMATNSAVLNLDIPPQLKALATILRKLYKQPGAGRKQSAFMRGITRPDVLRYIDPILALLERHQFISVFNSVVHPVRRQTNRVDVILASPALADDPVAVEARALQ